MVVGLDCCFPFAPTGGAGVGGMLPCPPQELDCKLAPGFGNALENGAGGGGILGEILAMESFGGQLGGSGGGGGGDAAEFERALEFKEGGGGGGLATVLELFSGRREEIEALEDATPGDAGAVGHESMMGGRASLKEFEGSD